MTARFSRSSAHLLLHGLLNFRGGMMFFTSARFADAPRSVASSRMATNFAVDDIAAGQGVIQLHLTDLMLRRVVERLSMAAMGC